MKFQVGKHQGGPGGGGWNADWEAFVRWAEHGTRTRGEIFDFAVELMQKYGVNASQLW